VPQAPDGPGTTDGVYVNLDQRDGFQAERREITQALLDANEGRRVENFVVITGNLHSYIAGYVRENYDPTPPVPETEAAGDPNPTNRPLGTCFVCGSVTSSNLVELAVGAGNADFPQVDERFLESEDGLSALQSAFQEPSNPHIEFFNSSTHGYNVMEVTREKLTCTMFGVETTQQPTQNGQP
jgi:alkaline phosphatase D